MGAAPVLPLVTKRTENPLQTRVIAATMLDNAQPQLQVESNWGDKA
jgi:hypothetical protein